MTMDQEQKAPGRLLHGTLVRLTALTPDDLPTIAGWYENTEFLRLFDSRPAYPQTEKELARWLEEMQKSANDFPFGIRRLDNDDLIGYVEIDGVAQRPLNCVHSDAGQKQAEASLRQTMPSLGGLRATRCYGRIQVTIRHGETG